MSWQPADVVIAQAMAPDQTRAVPGYVYRGLGLHLAISSSRRRRKTQSEKPQTWALTHLGSGHRVAFIRGRVAVAFPIAAEIAECGDWSFDGLEGWRNVDPELPKRVFAIIERHGRKIWLGGGGCSHDAARAVAMARAA